MMSKQMFFVMSSMLLCINIIGMEQKSSFELIPHEIIYHVTHYCSLQSIGRFKQTNKKYGNDDINNPYYTGRLMCGVDRNSSKAIAGVINEMVRKYTSTFIGVSDTDFLKRVYQKEALIEDYLLFLRYFAEKKDLEMFDYYYDNLLNPRDYGQLFDYALSNYNYGLASFLATQKQEKIYFNNYRKDNFLWLACMCGDNKTVEICIANGANINYAPGYNRETPLHCACRKNNVALAKFLIENDADINSANVIGESSLDIMKRKSEFKELVDSLYFLDKKFDMVSGLLLAVGAGAVGMFFLAKISK